MEAERQRTNWHHWILWWKIDPEELRLQAEGYDRLRSVFAVRRRVRSGFTLLEMSIVLAIIAVIVGGAATLFNAWLQKQQLDVTNARLAAIREALYNYRIVYSRLPCPSYAATDITDPHFAIEGTPPGDCEIWGGYQDDIILFGTTTSGSNVVTGVSLFPATASLAVGDAISFPGYLPTGTYITKINSSTTITLSQVVTGWNMGAAMPAWQFEIGMVPTKTLGLPDDYAFDGWGRRMMYAVDVGLNRVNGFTTIPASDTSTRMTVKDASGNAKTTKAAYVLISYGPNGHGAIPRFGGYTRISSGSVNADELTNCGCNSNGNQVGGGITGTFVQKAPTQDPTQTNHTDDFDDIVVFGTRSDLRSPNE